MRNKSIIKELYALLPLVFSGLLCIGVSFLLWNKTTTTPDFVKTLEEVTGIFISISGFLSAIIMIYLASSALGLRQNRDQVIDSLGKITRQMHSFRSIIDILVRSKLWLPGLREYIDEEFAGLTFFEVKEFYKGKSKLAIEFLQESNQYDDTENLYLELKSLLMTSPKQKKLPETLKFPKVYENDIVQKWLEHKCGSGLWYFFGYKYATFKDSLDFNAVFERHQEKVMALAQNIDSTAFEDSSFNEVFLSKLGEYMTNEVLPKLFQFQGKMNQRLPGVIKYLYFIFLTLTLGGVLVPLAYLLFGLPVIFLIVSFSLVIALIFFIATSFYPFLHREIYQS